jgi:hypothetical protein
MLRHARRTCVVQPRSAHVVTTLSPSRVSRAVPLVPASSSPQTRVSDIMARELPTFHFTEYMTDELVQSATLERIICHVRLLLLGQHIDTSTHPHACMHAFMHVWSGADTRVHVPMSTACGACPTCCVDTHVRRANRRSRTSRLDADADWAVVQSVTHGGLVAGGYR